MCRVIEAQIRHAVISSLFDPELNCLTLANLGGTLINLPRFLTGRVVWIFINVFPCRRSVRPRHQTEPLNETVSASAAIIGAADIMTDAGRVSVSEHRNANRVNVQVPAHDAVKAIGLLARPPRKVKAAGARLVAAV